MKSFFGLDSFHATIVKYVKYKMGAKYSVSNTTCNAILSTNLYKKISLVLTSISNRQLKEDISILFLTQRKKTLVALTKNQLISSQSQSNMNLPLAISGKSNYFN